MILPQSEFTLFLRPVYFPIVIAIPPRREKQKGPVAQLNRASDYGSEGLRFESLRDHIDIQWLQ